MGKIKKEKPKPHVVIPDTSILWHEDKHHIVTPDFNSFWTSHADKFGLELVIPTPLINKIICLVKGSCSQESCSSVTSNGFEGLK